MNKELDDILKDRESWFAWKNIKPIYDLVQEIKSIKIDDIEFCIDDCITITHKQKLPKDYLDKLDSCLKSLIPWRKGPFKIFNQTIDTEWQSFIKYDIIKNHFDIKGKIVADVGCNNGYYMFRMTKEKPKKLVGFDPSPLFKLQFEIINHFIKSKITYHMLGVEHIDIYHHKFDTIFMLGVLYHRPDPIGTLKMLNRSLNKNGEIIIDTFIIDGYDDICLTPQNRYAKMPNIYFIPTISALSNWLNRAGFFDIQLLDTTITTKDEQRATSWTFEQSLDDFLDKNDKNKTVEGYQAPKRAYIKAKKK